MACSTCPRILQLLIGLSGLFMILSADAGDTSVLRLRNDDFVAGELTDSLRPDHIGWRSPQFTIPLEFSLFGITGISFPLPEKAPKPVGEYFVEHGEGNILFGSLIAFEGDEVVFDTEAMGRLHIQRDGIKRMSRWTGGDELLFLGPNGLAGWNIAGEPTDWREEAGRLVSRAERTTISRDFNLPAKSQIEFELSWKGKPDFELALAADGTSAFQAYRFEVWDTGLVVARETESKFDVTGLFNKSILGTSIRLNVFLDQRAERLSVYSAAGKFLGDMDVSNGNQLVHGGILLTCKTGEVRLEQLRISRWNGELPRAVDVDKARIHLSDGTIQYGQLKNYDAARHEFQFDDATSVTSIAENRVVDICLSTARDESRSPLRLFHFDGEQLRGELEKIEAGVVWLKCRGIKELIPSPIARLQSLAVTLPKGEPTDVPGRQGKIEFEGAVLHGCLAKGSDADGGCLVWHPLYASSASPLLRGTAARIVYRETPTPKPHSEPMVPVQRALAVPGVVPADRKDVSSADRTTPKVASDKQAPGLLHLRSGDKVQCAVVGVTEEGIMITSTFSADPRLVKHDKIKALELIPDFPSQVVAPLKKSRLLVLPRMQRDNPPTQLIRSTTGDYLRGRLVGINDNEVKVEVRLDEKIIPRDVVARIIWLHSDETDPKGKTNKVVDEPTGATRVQAVPHKGHRLTFQATRFEETFLSGQSDILGECSVDVQNLDQILVGGAIERVAASLEFAQWRLKPAIDPLGAPEATESAEEGNEGMQGALVGKPAPGIDLKFLDGSQFRLADYKNKIVVLDFWASWCGPCLQTMPQVDAVAAEFADKNVVLVAINLEESADKVKAALGRLKLETTVALDRNGRVSERYGVTSIPQTVIINGEGKVVRLFVGGSPRFGDQLRAALQNILADQPVEKK